MTHTTKQVLAVAAIAAVSLFSAGTALAQEASSDAWMQQATSTQSRAQVVADLAAARQSGLTLAWSEGYVAPQRSVALRATVRAETLRAIDSGEVDAINAEVYSFTPAGPLRVSQASR